MKLLEEPTTVSGVGEPPSSIVAGSSDAEPFRDNLLESLLATIPDHIYFKDRQSRFIRINQACGDRHGLADLGEIVGKTDFDMFDPEHAQMAFDDERRIMETGIALEDKEETPTWADGKPCWVSSTKVPFRDAHGNIVGIIGISRNITERKLAELEQDRLQRQVVDLSRLAGMSEVAASVLHNVGNVLNSVNVSCTVLTEMVRESKVASLARTAAILKEHEADLARFLSEDPKGNLLPDFLGSLAERLVSEQEAMLGELALLNRNIDHIAQIINVQQSLAQVGGLREMVDIGVLVEAALQMNASMFMRHHMEIVRDFEKLPEFWADKHKILQILVNLIRNAKHALADGGVDEKCLTIRVAASGVNSVAISVADNGIGIASENLVKVFEYGFTTKKDGHGFGLHGGALSAQEMGGRLSVSSGGRGLGATFTLEIPMHSESQG